MSDMSYISVIERYHEYREILKELLASIVIGIADQRLLEDVSQQKKVIRCVNEHYPFVNLFYTLDPFGVQCSDNLGGNNKDISSFSARGKDRSQRPYFRMARDSDQVVVTEPYLSSASRNLCISAAVKLDDVQGEVLGYIVVDSDLGEIIGFLMGDNMRRRFQPFLKTVYILIVVGLFTVVGILLYSAFREIALLFTQQDRGRDVHITPFGVIIFLTLGLAVFDLGKTTLEEEVLMHKDIFRHSSTRRTITRFMAAILIAISIEALLMMFKAALGEDSSLMPAVWMTMASVGLLVGLGLYVFLGSKAEAILMQVRKNGV
jgi:hypothetical protein